MYYTNYILTILMSLVSRIAAESPIVDQPFMARPCPWGGGPRCVGGASGNPDSGGKQPVEATGSHCQAVFGQVILMKH